jgi:hypothetical protein
MAEHNVVHQGDFGPNNGAEYFARKAGERADLYTGGPKLQAEIKKDLIAATEKVAQGYKPAIQRDGGDI